MAPEPVSLDAVIADMQARAEGWNSERFTMLSPEAAGALLAELDRLRAVETELESARHALGDDEALWRRMLPRLERWADDRNRRMARDHGMQAAEWRVRAGGTRLE